MRYLNSILEAVGNIPLVRLQKIVGPDDATLLVKPEFLNPGGSIKDRMAMYILDKAEREGRIKPGATIVENTSGNTGAGVALWAATRGFHCVFTMPDKMSKEKVDTLKAFGADVVVTPTNVAAEHPDSYYETAKRIARETPNSFYLNQYHNPDNIEAHYRLTGPEIYEQSGGRIDYFVAGLGTGGTMSGAGKFLKEKIPSLKNVGVDPIGSIYFDYFKTKKMGTPHVYKVEGIGEDMLCKAMDFSVLDDVRQVDDRQSFLMARRMAREEGIFAGGSSGAAVHVAAQVAREAGKGKIVIAILPDHGNRYISKFYSDEWMRDNGFIDGRGLGLVRDLAGSLRQELVTAKAEETCAAVAARMKQFGISQMPVVNAQGDAVGMIHEYDLLQFLLEGKHRADEKIEVQVAPLQGVVMMDTPLSRLKDIFAQDNVAVVKDGPKVVAVITKIDLIDFLSKVRG